MRDPLRLLLAASVLALLTGCQTPQQPDITTTYDQGPKIVTFALDPRDYNEVAARLHDSIVSSGKADQGRVIALGAIAVDLDRDTRFDAITLQEKLQVAVHRSGLYRFSFAVKAVSVESNDAATRKFREIIQQIKAAQEAIDNREDDITFGGLAAIDYIIFGRLSSQTQRKGARQEVTYRFNYKLGNCKSGLIRWTDEVEFVKSK